MNLSEYVAAARTFTAEEMNACATKGECHQCGLCCVVFADNELPIKIPDSLEEAVTLVSKDVLEVCPHLKSDGKGAFLCAGHGMKDHSSLTHCRDWKGSDRSPIDFFGPRTNFEIAIGNFWTQVIFEAKGEELMAANEMVRKGLIDRLILEYTLDVNVATNFLKQVFSLKELPHELLELMQWKKIMELSKGPPLTALMDNLGLNSGDLTPIQREFKEKYLPRD